MSSLPPEYDPSVKPGLLDSPLRYLVWGALGLLVWLLLGCFVYVLLLLLTAL